MDPLSPRRPAPVANFCVVGGARRGDWYRWRGVWCVVIALVVSGCVGAVPRDEFDEMVAERGGGLVSALPVDAIDMLEESLGATDLAFEQITVTPASRSVGLTVQDPAQPANLDRYNVYEGELGDPSPVQLSAEDDVGSRLFTLDEVPALTRLEELADVAVAELGMDGGVVTSVTVRRGPEGATLRFSVESERARGSAVFAADGTLIEAGLS